MGALCVMLQEWQSCMAAGLSLVFDAMDCPRVRQTCIHMCMPHCRYRWGSLRMGLESPRYAVPSLQWLAVRQHQLQEVGADAFQARG